MRRRIAIVVTALLAASMLPLAVEPWGVQAPAAGILAFGLATMRRDAAAAASVPVMFALL